MLCSFACSTDAKYWKYSTKLVLCNRTTKIILIWNSPNRIESSAFGLGGKNYFFPVGLRVYRLLNLKSYPNRSPSASINTCRSYATPDGVKTTPWILKIDCNGMGEDGIPKYCRGQMWSKLLISKIVSLIFQLISSNSNFKRYRKFEMTMNWDENQFIGNQVIIAHKDARFLKLYLESYRDNYHSDRWYVTNIEWIKIL